MMQGVEVGRRGFDSCASTYYHIALGTTILVWCTCKGDSFFFFLSSVFYKLRKLHNSNFVFSLHFLPFFHVPLGALCPIRFSYNSRGNPQYIIHLPQHCHCHYLLTSVCWRPFFILFIFFLSFRLVVLSNIYCLIFPSYPGVDRKVEGVVFLYLIILHCYALPNPFRLYFAQIMHIHKLIELNWIILT